MKIESKEKPHNVYTQIHYGEVQIIVDGVVSYIPLGALSKVINALTVIEKNEYYKAVLS